MKNALLGFWGALLVGCSPTTDYEIARDACGMDPGLDIPMPYSEQYTFYPITDACAAHLAEDIGMRWDTFQAQPGRFRAAENTAERVIGGVFTLISADTGTIGETLTDPSLPAWLSNDLFGLSWLRQMHEDDPAGALWYAYLTRRAWRVLYEAELNAQMRMGRNHAIEVGPLDAAFSPAMISSFLMHEASHRTSAVHVACDAAGSEDCDLNSNGAYGVGIFWMHRWLSTSAALLPVEECVAVELMMWD
ncbi:MAG: hypothetical protein AAFV53_28060, partial [Myxococcota bacterium]